ncbi:lasso peptide biosynthesis B2 protein [Altererythrobacter sp. GH1-8]|uniref:lasso peptide biosynthesis B2 protein n=1 Tax=Altererythrobacter sp. GH1-8 TaxID=3349333 RepID=UPI00374DE082
MPRAIFELLRARIALVRLTPKRLLALNDQARTMAALASQAHSREAETLERITFLLPRIAARLPWRSDCLVQALAAQRWLSAHSVAATIEIGVQRDAESEFRAHAWLLHQGQVVLGGEAGDFTPLLAQE